MKVISAISEDLFDRQPEAYRHSVLPPEAYYDLMVVSTGTRRVWPVRDLGPLTDAYSLTSDWDNQWLTGGLEPDVIAEAHLDPESIFAGIQRFANEREQSPRKSARPIECRVDARYKPRLHGVPKKAQLTQRVPTTRIAQAGTSGLTCVNAAPAHSNCRISFS